MILVLQVWGLRGYGLGSDVVCRALFRLHKFGVM